MFTPSDVVHKDKTMRPTRNRSRWTIVGTVRQGTLKTVHCLWQDLQGMQKDQSLQDVLQVSLKIAAGPETTKECQVNP